MPLDPRALYLAADGLCICCARPMPEVGDITASKGARPTLEHVFPKHPAPSALPIIARFLRIFPFRFRPCALAHSKCNNRKGNRAPTGCEVIFLLAVNARTGMRISARSLRLVQKTRTEKLRRNRRNRRLRDEMQRALDG